MNKTILHATSLIILLSLTLCGCDSGYRYTIGVAQCVGGPWREKANNEMLSAQHLYDKDVKVTIMNANNDNRLQCSQIDSLVDMGVDLLVVSPNDYHAIDKSLQRAKDRNIPVVFFDRATAFKGYAAYIGGDNVDAGRQMARYAAMLCRDSVKTPGRLPVVLEIKGPEAISPSAQRHRGFAGVMGRESGVDYRCVPSNWSYEESKAIMGRWLEQGKTVDVVFCHSDLATKGAYDAAKEAGKEKGIRFLGIDGLPGEGIDAVQRGQLAASYIYPTHGEEIVALALRILEGKPYSRDNILKSFVVTPQNVSDVAISSNALMNQNRYLATIQGKLETYLGFYHIQRTLLLVLLLVIVLLAVGVGLTLRAVKATRTANRRMRELNDEQTRFFTNASHQLRTPLTLIAGPLQQLAASTGGETAQNGYGTEGQNGNGTKGQNGNGTEMQSGNAAKPLGEEDRRKLLDIVQRNVAQLQRLVNDVLLFRRENRATVADETATTDAHRAESAKSVMEGRHEAMLNANADELGTVLIVDDNADMRSYLRTLLLDRYYVIEAPDGQSGLRLAVESVPDIVVSDVMMPVMDGLTFCSRLKQHAATSHIPVILLTARSSERQHIEGLQTGADIYMTKPFSADLLLANIASLLQNRLRLRKVFARAVGDEDAIAVLTAGSKEAAAAAAATSDGTATLTAPAPSSAAKPSSEHTASTASTPERRFLENFMLALNKHMGDTQLKVDDLGDEMGLSRVQLYRKVKALTGLSPTEILREARLKKARQLLVSTDKTVAEVAAEVGFATPGYFSSCFKKQFGKYPTDVREERNRL